MKSILILALWAALAAPAYARDAAAPPAERLDDPIFGMTFTDQATPETLETAIRVYLSQRPGLRRYAEFKVRIASGASLTRLPPTFVGRIGQLITSIACMNGLGIAQFDPDGVTYTVPDEAHPAPRCSTQD